LFDLDIGLDSTMALEWAQCDGLNEAIPSITQKLDESPPIEVVAMSRSGLEAMMNRYE
jgi:hypothetical protein